MSAENKVKITLNISYSMVVSILLSCVGCKVTIDEHTYPEPYDTANGIKE
tara:strand:- start:424 stop:573 length:150 start_codon:yes stop_codon:yes gene_type:complete